MPHKRLGLTGSIGAGKSTVADLLRRRGFVVLDADEVARDVSRSPDVLAEVASAFGPGAVVNGELNRPLLSSLVFASPEKRAALNAIVHPRVRSEMERRERAASGAWVVQDVPLLFEGGLDASMDATIVVDAPLETRIARVMARDHLARDAVLARDAAQMPPEEKRRRASFVLVNDGDLASLERQLDAALTALGVSV